MFCAFHKESTQYLRVYRNGCWQDAIYRDKGSCTKAIRRAAGAGQVKAADYAVLSLKEFKKIEKTVVVRSLLTGAQITQSVNTPYSCDPSRELYWTM
jgi:hypothetical protein